jgi:hypothetical protein
MTTILESLSQQLGSQDTVRQIGRQIGVDEQQAGTAVAAALPLLLGALNRNASQPEGAEALFGALERDHDGSILDNLQGFLANASAGPGASILGHVLGDRNDAVAANLGRTTGLDKRKAAMLLMTLAPIVLGALGRARQQHNLNAGTLASTLGNERARVVQTAGPAATLLEQMLDKDGDGSIADDVAQQGLGMLGKMFDGGR